MEITKDELAQIISAAVAGALAQVPQQRVEMANNVVATKTRDAVKDAIDAAVAKPVAPHLRPLSAAELAQQELHGALAQLTRDGRRWAGAVGMLWRRVRAVAPERSVLQERVVFERELRRGVRALGVAGVRVEFLGKNHVTIRGAAAPAQKGGKKAPAGQQEMFPTDARAAADARAAELAKQRSENSARAAATVQTQLAALIPPTIADQYMGAWIARFGSERVPAAEARNHLFGFMTSLPGADALNRFVDGLRSHKDGGIRWSGRLFTVLNAQTTLKVEIAVHRDDSELVNDTFRFMRDRA